MNFIYKMLFETGVIIVAALALIALSPLLIYYYFKAKYVSESRCRYAAQCRYYKDNYTCNHDFDAASHCGVFRQWKIWESDKNV